MQAVWDGRRRGSPVFFVLMGFLVGVLCAQLISRNGSAGASRSLQANGSGSHAASSDLGVGGAGAGTAADQAAVGTPSSAGGTAAGAKPGTAGAKAVPGATTPGAAVAPDRGAKASSPGAAEAARGVADDKVTIGFPIIDDQSFPVTGPGQDHYNAFLAALRREKRLPVNGRDIDPVFQRFNLLDASTARAACVAIAQDHKVFSVVSEFGMDPDCIAGEFKIPYVDASNEVRFEAMLRRNWSYMVSAYPSIEREVKHFGIWLHNKGLLTNKTVGIYYADNDATKQIKDNIFKPILAGYGYKIAVEVPAAPTERQLNDVLKFQGANVNALVDLGDVISDNFMNAAASQQYHPLYLGSGFSRTLCSEGIAETRNNAQMDGTTCTVAEDKAIGQNIPDQQPSALAKWCMKAYKDYSGKDVSPQPATQLEWQALMFRCDALMLTLKSLEIQGRSINPLKVVPSLETLSDFGPLALLDKVSFSPTKHDGAIQQRDLQWKSSCTCFKYLTPYYPMFA